MALWLLVRGVPFNTRAKLDPETGRPTYGSQTTSPSNQKNSMIETDTIPVFSLQSDDEIEVFTIPASRQEKEKIKTLITRFSKYEGN